MTSKCHSYILKQKCSWKLLVCLSMYNLLNVVLVSLLLILNISHTFYLYFYCWLRADKCLMRKNVLARVWVGKKNHCSNFIYRNSYPLLCGTSILRKQYCVLESSDAVFYLRLFKFLITLKSIPANPTYFHQSL